jgi:hypothetical protein
MQPPLNPRLHFEDAHIYSDNSTINKGFAVRGKSDCVISFLGNRDAIDLKDIHAPEKATVPSLLCPSQGRLHLGSFGNAQLSSHNLAINKCIVVREKNDCGASLLGNMGAVDLRRHSIHAATISTAVMLLEAGIFRQSSKINIFIEPNAEHSTARLSLIETHRTSRRASLSLLTEAIKLNKSGEKDKPNDFAEKLERLIYLVCV